MSSSPTTTNYPVNADDSDEGSSIMDAKNSGQSLLSKSASEWEDFVQEVFNELENDLELTETDKQAIRAQIMGRSDEDFTKWIPSSWNPYTGLKKELEEIQQWMNENGTSKDWKTQATKTGRQPPHFPHRAAILAPWGVFGISSKPSYPVAKADLNRQLDNTRIKFLLGVERCPEFWEGLDMEVDFDAHPSWRGETKKPMKRRQQRFMTKEQGKAHRVAVLKSKKMIWPLRGKVYSSPKPDLSSHSDEEKDQDDKDKEEEPPVQSNRKRNLTSRRDLSDSGSDNEDSLNEDGRPSRPYSKRPLVETVAGQPQFSIEASASDHRPRPCNPFLNDTSSDSGPGGSDVRDFAYPQSSGVSRTAASLACIPNIHATIKPDDDSGETKPHSTYPRAQDESSAAVLRPSTTEPDDDYLANTPHSTYPRAQDDSSAATGPLSSTETSGGQTENDSRMSDFIAIKVEHDEATRNLNPALQSGEKVTIDLVSDDEAESPVTEAVGAPVQSQFEVGDDPSQWKQEKRVSFEQSPNIFSSGHGSTSPPSHDAVFGHGPFSNVPILNEQVTNWERMAVDPSLSRSPTPMCDDIFARLPPQHLGVEQGNLYASSATITAGLSQFESENDDSMPPRSEHDAGDMGEPGNIKGQLEDDEGQDQYDEEQRDEQPEQEEGANQERSDDKMGEGVIDSEDGEDTTHVWVTGGQIRRLLKKMKEEMLEKMSTLESQLTPTLHQASGGQISKVEISQIIREEVGKVVQEEMEKLAKDGVTKTVESEANKALRPFLDDVALQCRELTADRKDIIAMQTRLDAMEKSWEGKKKLLNDMAGLTKLDTFLHGLQPGLDDLIQRIQSLEGLQAGMEKSWEGKKKLLDDLEGLAKLNTFLHGLQPGLDQLAQRLHSLEAVEVGTAGETIISRMSSNLSRMETDLHAVKEQMILEVRNGEGFDWKAAESQAAKLGDVFTVGLDMKLVRWDPSLWQRTQDGVQGQSDASSNINSIIAQMDARTWNVQRKYLHWLAGSHKVDYRELVLLMMDWKLTVGVGIWEPCVSGIELGRRVYVEATFKMYDEPSQRYLKKVVRIQLEE